MWPPTGAVDAGNIVLEVLLVISAGRKQEAFGSVPLLNGLILSWLNHFRQARLLLTVRHICMNQRGKQAKPFAQPRINRRRADVSRPSGVRIEGGHILDQLIY